VGFAIAVGAVEARHGQLGYDAGLSYVLKGEGMGIVTTEAYIATLEGGWSGLGLAWGYTVSHKVWGFC